jgi:hypothetical protein
MKTEYIIWGVRSGQQYEEPLHTVYNSLEAQKARLILEAHGVRRTRVQRLEFKDGSEVAGMFARAVNI